MFMKDVFVQALVAATFIQSVACAQDTKVAADTRHARAVVVDSTADVRQFVQTFYDWYTPMRVRGVGHPAEWEVLTKADRYLDSSLATLLRGDSVAGLDGPQRATRVTLDFDPFLGGQDPCGPSKVIDVRRRALGFRVTVLSCFIPPDLTKGPRVTVDVIPVNGAWRISNVDFGDVDLKSLLCKYAKADVRPEKRPTTC
jgi:hypothetical protein